jgi:hypothetical protein
MDYSGAICLARQKSHRKNGHQYPLNDDLSVIIFEKSSSDMSSALSEPKEIYRTFMGCEVLWPPDCPDDILEAVIKEVKSQ